MGREEGVEKRVGRGEREGGGELGEGEGRVGREEGAEGRVR